MAEVWLEKMPDGTVAPMGPQDAERLKRFKVGVPFKADVKKPRNGRHHRLGFSMLQWVFNNQERYDVFEHFMVEMKILTGHFSEHITLEGRVVFTPKSLRFEAMDEIEWGEWRSKAVDAILKHFMPDMDRPEFENALAVVLEYAK